MGSFIPQGKGLFQIEEIFKWDWIRARATEWVNAGYLSVKGRPIIDRDAVIDVLRNYDFLLAQRIGLSNGKRDGDNYRYIIEEVVGKRMQSADTEVGLVYLPPIIALYDADPNFANIGGTAVSYITSGIKLIYTDGSHASRVGKVQLDVWLPMDDTKESWSGVYRQWNDDNWGAQDTTHFYGIKLPK